MPVTPSRPVMHVDRRVGSRELCKPLQRMGLRVALVTLPFGDVEFPGSGDGRSLLIGVERKTVDEMLGCQIDTRFTSRQLPGMLTRFDVAWLLIEGSYRPGRYGELIIGGGRDRAFSGRRHGYTEFEAFLLTLQQKAGIRIVRSGGFTETITWLHTLYSWWQKPWEKHQSLYAISQQAPDSALLRPQSMVLKIAAQLPGIGWTRAHAVDKAFANVREMVRATPSQWAAIDGIGRITARRVWRALREIHRDTH